MSVAGVKKGPYNVLGRYSLEQRARQLEQPPLCKCGCGNEVEWDRGRARWRRYASVDCYHPPRPYWSAEWLQREYVVKRRSSGDIAREFSVGETSVIKALRRNGIRRRSASECQIGVNAGAKNPAWKGGVAKWDYAPEWKRIARQVREEARYTCERCGERRKRWGRALHVHHIDKNKLNNERTNLVALCAPCHRKVEYE